MIGAPLAFGVSVLLCLGWTTIRWQVFTLGYQGKTYLPKVGADDEYKQRDVPQLPSIEEKSIFGKICFFFFYILGTTLIASV